MNSSIEESCGSLISKLSPQFPASYAIKELGSFSLTEGFNRISLSYYSVSKNNLIAYETTTPGLIALIDDKTLLSDYFIHDNKTRKVESNKNYKFSIKALVYESFYLTRTDYIRTHPSIGLYNLTLSTLDYLVKVTKIYNITNGKL